MIESSQLKFRSLLADFAPLPWRMQEDQIVDANGRIVLSVYEQRAIGNSEYEKERSRRVMAAVMTGIATVAGYRIGPDCQMALDVVTGERVRDSEQSLIAGRMPAATSGGEVDG